MKHAKLFSLLVIVALSIYAMAGFYLLPLAGFEGGLTRMSKLPESQFGWTKPQPAIAPELLRQAEWQDADVLVVGDSFSMEHLWQTVLAQHGLRVRTETWENIRDICEDFTPWLKSQGFKGSHIIIEIIERNAEDVINRSLRCKNMSYHSVLYPPASPPAVLPNRQHADYSGKLSVGIQTQLHSLAYMHLSKHPDFRRWDLPNNVRMERLAEGCDLFSHPRCQDVLFLAEDRTQDFNETMLDKMSTINSRLSGVTPIWAIVPDKSTAYLNPNKQFWHQAASRFQSPDLLETFRLAIRNKTVDLYRGNDTHLSTEGYLIMGEAIRQSMTHP
jgi:hypothetical protein